MQLISFLPSHIIHIKSSNVFLNSVTHIVEKNPSKFKIDNKELTGRKTFIDSTREEVKSMKEKINMNRNRDRDRTARQVSKCIYTRITRTCRIILAAVGQQPCACFKQSRYYKIF